MEVTRKIDAIGTTGGGLQDLAADMDKAIDAFYNHRDEPAGDDGEEKLLIDLEREKKAKAEAARKAAEKKAATPPVRRPAPPEPEPLPPLPDPNSDSTPGGE